MQLTLVNLPNGGLIARKFTCDGEDLSPALQWSDPPPDTKSFMIVVDDPDAPGRTFTHWGAYDIAADVRSLEEGAGNGRSGGIVTARNDFGTHTYRGPCPPEGHGPHGYRFKLVALDVAKLDAGPSPTVARLEHVAEKHQLGIATVTAYYERG